MQELNDERVLFAFARDLEPALTVASGETVRIRTQDCFGNQVQTPEDELDEIDRRDAGERAYERVRGSARRRSRRSGGQGAGQLRRRSR